MDDNTQSPQEPMQAPAMSEADALALLARAHADPFMAEALAKLREDCLAMLDEIVREVSVSLPEPDQKADVASQQTGANSLLAFKSLSHQLRTGTGQRRELAQAMVMGAILNRNNPEWDPLDPATDKASTENLILSLFQLPPPATPGTE